MSKRKEPFNPFYLALLVLGFAFTVTACAYTVMMVRATSASSDEAMGLMKLLDERGMEIMGAEVLLLGVATAGAIGLDQWRGKRDAARKELSERN